jgi:SPP1 family predicted phage head-tail adaptor
MINAGQLNKRITFQTPVVIPIEGITSYTDYCTVWAAIRPLVGNRRYQAQQYNSEIAGQIIIRYRNDITSSMRIKYLDRRFQILSIINPGEVNEALEIEYKELLD